MTEKSDDRVGHLNTTLARGSGNLQKLKCPGFAREGDGGGGGVEVLS